MQYDDVVVVGRVNILSRLIVGTIGVGIFFIVLLLLALPLYIFTIVALGLTYAALMIDVIWGLIAGREQRFLSKSIGTLFGTCLRVSGFFTSWQIQAVKYVLLTSDEKPYPFGDKPENLFLPAVGS